MGFDITGLDKLTKELHEAAKAIGPLGGNIATVRFDPDDSVSIAATFALDEQRHHRPDRRPLERTTELDITHQTGASWCAGGMMARSTQMKRFTVALEVADHAALRELGERQNPSVNLQYMVRLAVKDLLDHHTDKQIPLKLPRS